MPRSASILPVLALLALAGLAAPTAPAAPSGTERLQRSAGPPAFAARPDPKRDPFSASYRARPEQLLGAELLRVLHDPVALDFAVKARRYREEPDTLVVTLRGGGISLFDLSEPARPTLAGRWDSEEDVEGQDRRGDLLVVVGRRGVLHLFDVSRPGRLELLSSVELRTDPGKRERLRGFLTEEFGSGPFDALHVQLAESEGGRLHAFVTAPASEELIAVDVSDPGRPVQVGSVDTGIGFIEGIWIHRGHAMVGGFGKEQGYGVVDVRRPSAMRMVGKLNDPAYRQMVPLMVPYRPDQLMAACWGDPGGLAVFDASDPTRLREVGRLLRTELEHANRVKFVDDLAFLPLEQEPGGFAVIDVAYAEDPRLVAIVRDVPNVTMPYTLDVHRDHLYLFGTRQATMAVFRLDRGWPEKHSLRWTFRPGDEHRLGEGLPSESGEGRLFLLDRDLPARITVEDDRDGAWLEVDPKGDWSRRDGLALQHGFGETFLGRMPAWTIAWDLQVPKRAFDRNGCFSKLLKACNDIPLIQLDRANRDDAELFLKVGGTLTGRNGFIGNSGAAVEGDGLGGYEEAIEPDRWHRIVMVVDLSRPGREVGVWVDGRLVIEVPRIEFDQAAMVAASEPSARLPVLDGFLLLADDDGEMDATVRFRSITVWDHALGDDEVRALGTGR